MKKHPAYKTLARFRDCLGYETLFSKEKTYETMPFLLQYWRAREDKSGHWITRVTLF